LFACDRHTPAQIEQGLPDGFDDHLRAIHDKYNPIPLIETDFLAHSFGNDDPPMAANPGK
jgi:hypothetical protein